MSISNAAANGIIYGTYGLLLIVGVGIALSYMKFQQTRDFLSANGTRTAIPLALNFIASGKYRKERSLMVVFNNQSP